MKQNYSNDFNVLRLGKFQVKLQSCDWRFAMLSQIHKHVVLEQSIVHQIQSWKMQIKDCHQNSSNTYVNSFQFKWNFNIQTEQSLQPSTKIILIKLSYLKVDLITIICSHHLQPTLCKVTIYKYNMSFNVVCCNVIEQCGTNALWFIKS